MQTAKVSIVGIFPLIMDKMELPYKTGLPVESQIFRDESGRIGLPADNLFMALKEMVRMCNYDCPGRTCDVSLLEKLLRIEEKFLPFPIPEDKTEAPWVVDSRRFNIAVSPLLRPKFRNWSFDCTVIYNDSQTTQQKLLRLFELCGKFVGLGSWSPKSRGPFGRFKVSFS